MTRRYPLVVLERLRRHQAQVAAARVVAAATERANVEGEAALARHQRTSIESQQAEVRIEETIRLRAGGTRVSDLQRCEALDRRLFAELEQGRRAEQEQNERLAHARKAEAAARDVAGRSAGKALAVERHHAGWNERTRHQREEKELEAISDLHGTTGPRGFR